MADKEFLKNLYLTSDSELLVKGDRLSGVVEGVKSGDPYVCDAPVPPETELPDVKQVRAAR